MCEPGTLLSTVKLRAPARKLRRRSTACVDQLSASLDASRPKCTQPLPLPQLLLLLLLLTPAVRSDGGSDGDDVTDTSLCCAGHAVDTA